MHCRHAKGIVELYLMPGVSEIPETYTFVCFHIINIRRNGTKKNPHFLKRL